MYWCSAFDSLAARTGDVKSVFAKFLSDVLPRNYAKIPSIGFPPKATGCGRPVRS